MIWVVARHMRAPMDPGPVFAGPVPRSTAYDLVAVFRALFGAIARSQRIRSLTCLAARCPVVRVPVGHPFLGVADHVADPIATFWSRADLEDTSLLWLVTNLLYATGAP